MGTRLEVFSSVSQSLQSAGKSTLTTASQADLNHPAVSRSAAWEEKTTYREEYSRADTK
jgi:hypothetical protein